MIQEPRCSRVMSGKIIAKGHEKNDVLKVAITWTFMHFPSPPMGKKARVRGRVTDGCFTPHPSPPSPQRGLKGEREFWVEQASILCRRRLKPMTPVFLFSLRHGMGKISAGHRWVFAPFLNLTVAGLAAPSGSRVAPEAGWARPKHLQALGAWAERTFI